MNALVDAVNESLRWVADHGFPRNPVTKRLRSSDFITHRGQKLRNAHRSSDALCDILAGLTATQRYANVLEIGTLFGYSALHLGEAASGHGGHVTSIDLRVKRRKWVTGEFVEDIHELAIANVEEADLTGFITLMSGRSDVLMPQLTLAKRSFDLIFIDGSHSSHIVVLDVINALNLISERGVIILDDVSENVALRPHTHGGPNQVLMHLVGGQRFWMLPLSYNTLLLQPRAACNDRR